MHKHFLVLILPLLGVVQAEQSSKIYSRHIQLSVATLAPVTEETIWDSNCRPVPSSDLTFLVNEIRAKGDSVRASGSFEPLHIRVAINDPPRRIYIDASLGVKVIELGGASYYSVMSGSKLEVALRELFDKCQ